MNERILLHYTGNVLKKTKHLLHCLLFLCVIYVFFGITIYLSSKSHPIENYNIYEYILLYFFRLLPLLSLPQCIFNFCGLVFYDAFPKNVTLKGSLYIAPFICFRVVTRGTYPDLVRYTLQRNLDTCLKTGLVNYVFEVVTDVPLHLSKNRFVREIVVPTFYSTSTGVLFKARALQYCLESEVNVLRDEDWIVHLDEETLITENSIKGIVNFTLDGRHQFGQGLITYASEKIVNLVTTFADNVRVADDMGKLRFQFKMFHRPIFSWKGSFMVCQMGSERRISFDHGPRGSITEDINFSMVAFAKGYSFDFIEGEMLEKSPFSLCDFLQQRKRWVCGGLLVAHNSFIPTKYRILFAMTIYAKVTLPFALLFCIFSLTFPTPVCLLLDVPTAFVEAVCFYMPVYGAMKSLNWNRLGTMNWILGVIGTILLMPLAITLEAVSTVCSYSGNGSRFYIVEKRFPLLLSVEQV